MSSLYQLYGTYTMDSQSSAPVQDHHRTNGQNKSNVSKDSSTSGISYANEKDRIKTFWEWKNIYNKRVNYKDLARDGFIFRGRDDKVMCFSCHIVLDDWKGSDNVHNRHKAKLKDLQRQCDFMNHLESVSSEWTSTPRDKDPLDIDPMFPVLASVEARMETFKYWPSRNNQKAQDLADAGFYFKPKDGKPDRVRCFACAAILYAWEKDDDPLTEHDNSSPDCRFVHAEKLQRGLIPETVTQTLPVNENDPKPNPVLDLHPSVQAVHDIYQDDYSLEQIIKAFEEIKFYDGYTNEVSAEDIVKKLESECQDIPMEQQ